LPGLFIVIVGFGLSYLLYVGANRWERDRIAFEFKRRAGNTATALERSIEDHLEVLRTMEAITMVQEDMTDREGADRFESWVFLRGYKARHSGILALEWAPLVRESERSAFEHFMREAGYRNFRILELNEDGRLVTAARRLQYFPITSADRADRERKVIGFDVGSEPIRRRALLESRNGGVPFATEPFYIADGSEKLLVFQVFLPCYFPGAATGESLGQASELRGFAMGTFAVNELVRSALKGLNLQGIDFLLYEGPVNGSSRLRYVYESGVSEMVEQERATSDVVIPGGLHWDSTFNVAGRRWWALFFPSANYMAMHRSWVPVGAFCAGLLLSLLLGGYLVLLVGRTAKVRRLVATRTSELSQANAELEKEIQQRKRADSQIRRLSRAVEQSPSGVIITDTRGKIHYLNPTYARMIGYTRREVAGRTFRLFARGELPDEEFARMWQLIMSGKQWRGEFISTRKNGEEFWASATASPIVDEENQITDIVVVQENITERKRAEQQLFESEQRYRLLAENATDVIARFNEHMTFLYVSPACHSVLGYKPEELQDKSLLKLVLADDQPELEDAFRRVLGGEDVGPISFRFRRKDGEAVWLETTAKAIAGNDEEEAGIIATSRDVTERRQLEEQFRQAQKMEVVGRLAGGMAHDFNNYLTGILGFAQLTLRKLDENHPVRHYIEEIFTTSENAASLIKQLLTFARKQVAKTSKIRIDDTLAEMEKLIRTTIGEGIELHLKLESDGHIEADTGQIKQIVTNLVVNARDAMPSGGKLSIHTARVSIDEFYGKALSELGPGEYVLISVRDTGCGMSPEVIRHAFEPFYTTKEVGKGTGLGLSTVYGIVKQLGGEIEIYGEPGVGTEFKIYLRAVEPPGEERRETQKRVPYEGSECILVVEDNDAVRTVSCAILRSLGYEVLQARNGEDALRICQKQNGTIDAILTDVVMPQMGGPELVEQLRKARMEHKVIYTSGYNEHPFIEESRKKGGISFIEKPFTEERLGKVVRETLDAA